MGLRLLGPIELIVDRRVLNLGGPRQRTVLAMLALNANQVVPVEQLIDAVWGTSPPVTSRGQIQICISSLRKLFGERGQPGAIRTRPPGYLLEIATEDLDSDEFVRLTKVARTHADCGRRVEAAALFRSALALWRGRVLDDVPSEFVRRGAAIIEDQRVAALEERLRLDLLLGRHEEVSGELATLVDEFPLRERLYGFLGLALYRSNRQVDALEVFRRARTTLVDELGIEPGQELQNLERSMLNRDPALDLSSVDAGSSASPVAHVNEAVANPRQLPTCIADFTGRESEIAEVKHCLGGDRDTEEEHFAVRVVAISGRGGVGKSALAVRVAHEVVDDYPDGHLYANLATPDGDDYTSTLLARFLRGLGSGVPIDPRERAEAYRSRLAGKRLLVVIDNAMTEEQVLPLLPGGPTCAVIVTSRSRLSGLAGARWVDIDVLDADKSIELIAKIIDPGRLRTEHSAAVDLVKSCNGLPLALRIAGARLASRPHWKISDLVQRLGNAATRLDEFAHRGLELRSSIGLTYEALRDQAKRLFRLCALIRTPEFHVMSAAALLDTSFAQAEEVLDDLIEARVVDVVEVPGEQLRYYMHDLVLTYARERLAESETPAEHQDSVARMLGAWMALAEEAHREEYGGDYTILRGSAERWHPPGRDRAESLGVPTGWWETERVALVAAIRQAAATGLDELCWDLALTSINLFETKGYFDDWLETSELALAAAEGAGNRTGRAAMLYSLGTLHMHQRRFVDARECFTTALRLFEADGNTHGCALVLRNAAHVEALHQNFPGMLAMYASALEMMRAVGDRMGEAHILRSVAKYRLGQGDTDVAQGLLEVALAICQEVRCSRGEAQVMHEFAQLYLDTGTIDLARQALHRVLLIVRKVGDRIGEAHALYSLGVIRQREGRLDSAETTMLHAVSLARQVGERLIEGQALYTLVEIGMARGNSTIAVEQLIEAQRLFDESGSVLWHAKTLNLLSEIHVANGDVDLAADDLEYAANLLLEMSSVEAVRWRTQLQATRSALLADGVVGK
jgi:DNA-binding SARP family transcriptional activator/tetratricopeptide (TPR) repeat protein